MNGEECLLGLYCFLIGIFMRFCVLYKVWKNPI